MSDLRKAAEMALEALENMSPDMDTLVEVKPHIWEYRGSLVIQALRQALTPEVTPEVNEPEGWVKIDEVRQYFDSVGCGTIYKTAGEGRVPLYTAPQREWVGLTDEEIQAERHKLDCTAGWTYDHFARAIEAKLKGKNTAPYTKNDITAGVLHKEWVGLTANEVYECWKFADVVAAVEAKLKQKNVPQP